MEALIIYLIGYIVAYSMIKIWRNKTDLNEWGDVYLTLAISLASWVTVISVIVVLWTTYTKNNNKPPRFL